MPAESSASTPRRLRVDPDQIGVGDTSEAIARAASAELDEQEHKQILGHRERFAEISYGIMQAWVGFLIVLTMAQFSLKPLGLGLQPSEFIAVLTTTTAAVFGFGLLVGNFLFPRGGSAKRRV